MGFIFKAECSMVEKMESKKLALLCQELADNKKAENIVILDVHKVSSITDYFVIATGTSEPHLRAIYHELVDTLHDDYDIKPRATDGSLQTAWIVLDFFDVIVHIMRTDTREHYKLEDLWGDVPRIKVRKKKTPNATVHA
jgi:ribosome-associated protein